MQQLSHRGKATMFQSIEDVQMQTVDPYYEEADEGEYGTTPRQLATIEHQGSNQLSAQAGIFSSLQAGKNMQS